MFFFLANQPFLKRGYDCTSSINKVVRQKIYGPKNGYYWIISLCQ